MSIIGLFLSFINKRRSRRFCKIGENVVIPFNIRITGYERIRIGGGTSFDVGSWIAAQPLTGDNTCSLDIGNKCSIGRYAHIFATASIVIEDKVLIAEKVYISDNLHGYEDITKPVIEQPIVQKKPVVIGEGTWLGDNVCVIGASIGKHSIIGANSVVTHDVPDYCVAVGSPAKVIKKYDFSINRWVKV